MNTLQEALERGMAVAYHAARQPERIALVSEFGDRTWSELNTRANQLARVLRGRGIGAGDALAVVTRNRPEFVEGWLAAMRTGMRFTPVNFCAALHVAARGGWPRSVDCVTELPRMPSGKIQRRRVRAPYWAGRGRQIQRPADVQSALP